MASLNKVLLVGHLGSDPEVKTTANNLAVTNLSLATNEWRKVGEEMQQSTTWHRVVVFGKTAENVGKYLRKGSTALVEGRIQNGSYEKDGVKLYTSEVVANSVQFLDGKGATTGVATGVATGVTATAGVTAGQTHVPTQQDLPNIPF